MLKEKQVQLKERLAKIINEIGRSSFADEVRQDVISEFKSRNLNAGRASFVMTQNLDLNTLDENDEENILFLFLLAYAINKALDGKENIKINVEDYFTKLEVRKWIDYKETEKQDDIYPIVLEDVTQLNDRIWQLTLSAQELNRLSVANILLYNFRTQRNPKITVSGEKINMDTKKVQEIKERLLNGEQYPDQIRLNVLNTGEERPVYNAKNRTLTLNEGCIVNIFDGYHRKTANDLAIIEDESLDFTWSIMVSYLSEKMAHDFMTQIDKQKPIKKEFIQQMDYTRPENLVVDIIMNDKLSELAQVTKDDNDYITKNRALTKKSILADAIAENYADQIKTSMGIRNVGKWIVEFTDQLMGLYVEEFIANPYEIKERSLINHKNMFHGYIAMSAELQENREWKSILESVIDSIDFDISNSLWKDIGIANNQDANKSTRNKLYKLFKEAISQCMTQNIK